MISWYAEKPEWLAELVASLGAAGVDHVVAIDGAYAAFPDARGNSGSEQGAVVSATALGAGMGVTVHQPRNVDPWWGNEVEKRTALFTLGHHVAEAGTDWLMVVDADEVVLSHINRAKLEAIEEDVADVTIVQGGSFPMRKMFRAQESGISVQGYHARYVTGDGRTLWGPGEEIDTLAGNMLDVRVRHRPDLRQSARRRDKEDYYTMRERLRLER